MQNAIAYYRVSTARQGESGLGLESQRHSVERYAAGANLNILTEFTEVETGTGKRRRVEIFKAIDQAKEFDAVLLIAKLDRLSRSVSFTSALMDSGVKFVAVDMPEANELTINIMAAMAQHEAKMISERTKAALAAAKRRGVKLGSPQNLSYAAQLKGAAVRKQQATKADQRATYTAGLLRGQGFTLQAIANELNGNGFRTRKGRLFQPTTVKRLLDRQTAAV